MSDTISTFRLYKSKQAEKANIKVNQNLATDSNLDDSLTQCQILQLEKLSPFFIPWKRQNSNYLLWLSNEKITTKKIENILQIGKEHQRKFHINFQKSKTELKNSDIFDLIENLISQYSQTIISYETDEVIYPEDIDIINAFDYSEKEFLKASNCDYTDIESELNDSIETIYSLGESFLDGKEHFYLKFTKLKEQVDELYKKKNMNSKIAEVAQFLHTKFDESRENIFDEAIDQQIKRVLKINGAECILKFYESKIELDPSNYCHYFRYGEVLYHLGKYDQAQDLLLMAISIKQLPEIYIRLAMTYFKLGNYMKTKETCEQLRKISPNNTKTNIFLGLIKQAESNYKDAISQYDNAISESPDQILGYYFKAKCYQEMNEYEGVKEQVLIMDIIDPQNEAYEKDREQLRSQTEHISEEEFLYFNPSNILLDWAKKALE